MRTRTFAAVAVVVACAVGGGVFALSHDHEPFRNSPAASVTLEQIDPRGPQWSRRRFVDGTRRPAPAGGHTEDGGARPPRRAHRR